MTKHKAREHQSAAAADVGSLDDALALDKPSVEVGDTQGLVQPADGPLPIQKMVETLVTSIFVPGKAFAFEVLGGTHYDGLVPYTKGSIVESDDDLVSIYGTNRFRRLE